MSPACAIPLPSMKQFLGSARRFIFRLAHRAKSTHSRVSRDLFATHVQHIASQGPRVAALRTRVQPRQRWCDVVRAAAALPPRQACQGWPNACRPRHCVQARDHLWYGREDHDRHTAATRCANPTRDHPRLCARHDRCRQPSATSPISQDTRFR